MKRSFCVFLIIGFASGVLYADQYIVTKKGDGIWAVGTKQEGDTIVYTEKLTGKSVTVPISELDGVIQQVKRGQKYAPEYIEKQITKLKKLLVSHRQKLQRPLAQLLQEWEMFTKPSEEIEGEVPKLENAFMASEKKTTDFKTAHMGLAMLKYKDMSGSYTERIDTVMKKVLEEYSSVNMSRFDAWAKDEKLDLEKFYEARSLCAELVEHIDAAKKVELERLMKTIRVNVTKHVTFSVGPYFVKNKNVDGFLYGFDQLRRVVEDVADNEADKATANQRMEDYRVKVGKALADYNIDSNGFAIPAKEAEMVSGFEQYGDFLVYTDKEFVEEAVFVPVQNPGPIRISSVVTPVKMRVFFNRPQPEGRKYGVRITVPGEPYSQSQTFTFTNPIIVAEGNATINFQCDFSWLPADFSAGNPETGSKSVALALGYQSEDGNWKPMSKVCRLPAR